MQSDTGIGPMWASAPTGWPWGWLEQFDGIYARCLGILALGLAEG